MISAGNAIGTWAAALPLRSASGASTSQVSGSCGALPGTVEEALAKMRGLAGGNWVPCGVCRDQERLGWADILRMHGYVIVKLRSKDAPAAFGQQEERISRNLSQQLKFMRLDWGHDGFFFQTASNDGDFQSYCGSPDPSLPEALVTTLMFPRTRKYADVDPSVSMKRLIEAIDAVKQNSYDLASWNCNHFANLVVQILTGNGPEDQSPAMMALRWWPGICYHKGDREVREDQTDPMQLRPACTTTGPKSASCSISPGGKCSLPEAASAPLKATVDGHCGRQNSSGSIKAGGTNSMSASACDQPRHQAHSTIGDAASVMLAAEHDRFRHGSGCSRDDAVRTTPIPDRASDQLQSCNRNMRPGSELGIVATEPKAASVVQRSNCAINENGRDRLPATACDEPRHHAHGVTEKLASSIVVPLRHQLRHGHHSGRDEAARNRPAPASANDQFRHSNQDAAAVNEIGKQETAAKAGHDKLQRSFRPINAASHGNLPASACDRPRRRTRNSVSAAPSLIDAVERDQHHRNLQRSKRSINAGSHSKLASGYEPAIPFQLRQAV